MKKLLALLLAALMVVSMAACAKETGNSGTDATGATNADGKQVVTVWTPNRADMKYVLEKVDKFNKENKDGVYLDYKMYSDNYKQMLDLAFSTDSAPDIFQMSNYNGLVEAFQKGQLAPLDEYLTDEYKARFGEDAFKEQVNMIDGKTYSMPFLGATARLFYNQDIFDRVGIKEPPKTLKELVEYSKLITEKLSGEGIYGFAAPLKTASGTAATINSSAEMSGCTKDGYDFKNGKFDFSSWKPVLEAYSEIFKNGYAFPGCESLAIDPLRSQFAEGKIAMYVRSTHSEPGVYANQFPTKVNWNCAKHPTVDGQIHGKQALGVGGCQWAMSSKCAHKDAAWKVMEFLHSDDFTKGYYETSQSTGILIPSALEGAKDPEILTKMPSLKLDSNDKNYPLVPVITKLEGKSYKDVFMDIFFGLVSVDDGIADLNKRYNEAYDAMVAGGEERVIYPNFTNENLDISK